MRAGIRFSKAADTHEGDFIRVNTRKRESEVDDGSDYLLPIGTEGQFFAMDRTVLAGAVKGENVVSAFDSGTCPLPMEFLGGAVEAGMHDEERTLDAGFIHAMEVARERCVFVGNFYRQDGRIMESAAGF